MSGSNFFMWLKGERLITEEVGFESEKVGKKSSEKYSKKYSKKCSN